jgi:hypothetical protein
VNLNAPIGSNPANLGLLISSNQNLGSVTIKRGHRAQVIPGVGNGMLRYYDISPANNANLNATLRFTYFNGELNGLDENQLTYFRSSDLVTWSALSFTSRDTALNFVNNTGIASFSRFTLAGALNDPLPVRYVLFNVKCEKDKVVIVWKTAQEQNSNHFNIERSTDGMQWTPIGNQLAAGNSTTEKSYVYNDNNPVQNSYYRIAEYGNDGRVQFSGVLRSPCLVNEMFTAWPNPVQGQLFINIISRNESSATIKLFDSKGALVRVQKENLLRGSNLVKVDMTVFPGGSYSLTAEWNNGQIMRTIQLLKQ